MVSATSHISRKGRYVVSGLSNLDSRICRFPRSDPSDRVSGSGPPIRIWTSSGRFRSSLSPDPESGENWSRIEKTARFPQTRPVWVKSDPPGQFGPPFPSNQAQFGPNRTPQASLDPSQAGFGPPLPMRLTLRRLKRRVPPLLFHQKLWVSKGEK